MKSFLILCVFVFSSVAGAATNEIKENLLPNLSTTQKNLLNNFLLKLIESPSGYVIYGDRPMNVEVYDISTKRILSGVNSTTTAIIKGKELWDDFNLSLDNKEYILTSFEKDSKCHMVCINRKAFLQSVKENLPLFQYVLGPTLTPEKLLSELIASKSQFYSVLNNDSVLLGILFGQGTQNAILSTRVDYLTNGSNRNEEFPYVSKLLSKTCSALPRKYNLTPSLGFRSLMDEERTLEKMVAQSGKVKSFDVCKIPNFTCSVDSRETKDLLAHLEDTRKKILKATGSKNFLPEVLQKLFCNVSQTLEIPRIPQQKNLTLPLNKEETVAKLVGVIQKTIGDKKLLGAFLQGVQAREKGQQMPVPSEWKRSKGIVQLERELEACKNLERADTYFKHLSSRDDLYALIPNGIYYKILKNGTENVTSTKLKNVSFQYAMQILGDKQSKDWGVIKNENVNSLIPGIAFGLIGMAEGEERIIYVHPQYAYGEETLFPPNIAIVAQVRMLNFEEGDQEMQVLPPHQLVKRDHRDLLTRFEVLRGEEYFDEGVEFWDSIKKSGSYIDFQVFHKLFNTTSDSGMFQNSNQEQQFLSDLEYYLLLMQQQSA